MKDATRRAARMLRDLGSTSQEVAATLAQKGVCGVRNTVRFLNPVVRYIKTGVNAKSIDVMKGDTVRLTFGASDTKEIELPQPVRNFLHEFNHGSYPELERGCERPSSHS
jgi:hypothetical protein